ncbi:hypothetical protein CL634_11360 [bacterium]|nr:hypothetical protein [bacterium]
MAISRKIYTASNVLIKAHSADLNGGSAVGTELMAQPDTVQNATFTLTIPRADVNAFGVKGVVARPQLEAQSATIEFSWIPRKDANPEATDDLETLVDAPAAILSEKDLDALIQDTLQNEPKYVGVQVQNVGQIMNSLMTSLSGDATVGALPTFTASFLGAQPDLTGSGNEEFPKDGYGASEENPHVGNATTIAVTEPQDITAEGEASNDNGCVQSGAFTWDMPVELVLCLGKSPASEGEALSSPPGTASITIEGLQEVLAASAVIKKLKIGAYRFDLGANAEVDSRTHNMAVGELFGTYNYVVGSTADSCGMD